MANHPGAGDSPGRTIDYRMELPEPAAFARLFRTTGWDVAAPLTDEELARALAASWRAVSAYDGDRLVGTGRIVADGTLHALIVDVIVDPADRGRGIGTQVMRRLVDACTQARIRDVQLFCAAGKAPFYERLGFEARPVDAPGMELRQDAVTASPAASPASSAGHDARLQVATERPGEART